MKKASVILTTAGFFACTNEVPFGSLIPNPAATLKPPSADRFERYIGRSKANNPSAYSRLVAGEPLNHQ
jgi:hypothetical protein